MRTRAQKIHVFALMLGTFVFASQTASALEYGYKAVECAALLRSVQLASAQTPDTTKATLEAFYSLHNFNASAVAQGEKTELPSNGFAPVFATSEKSRSGQLLARLAGIEQHWNNQDSKITTLGLIGDSEESLGIFFDQEKVRTATSALQEATLLEQIQPYGRRLMWDAFLEFVIVVGTSSVHNRFAINLAVGVVFLHALYNYVAQGLTFEKSIDRRVPDKLSQTNSIIQNAKAGSWIYRGETYYVSQRFIDWLSKQDFKTSTSFYAFGDFVRYAEHEYSERATRWLRDDPRMKLYHEAQEMMASALKPPRDENFRILYIDELLQMKTQDDGSVQPELTLFVRIAKGKTKLKVKEKEKSRIGLRSLLPVKEQ